MDKGILKLVIILILLGLAWLNLYFPSIITIILIILAISIIDAEIEINDK